MAVKAAQRRGDPLGHGTHGATHVVAAHDAAAVAPVDRLGRALGRAGGGDRPADGAALKAHLRLHGGPAAAVEDAAAMHMLDRGRPGHCPNPVNQAARNTSRRATGSVR